MTTYGRQGKVVADLVALARAEIRAKRPILATSYMVQAREHLNALIEAHKGDAACEKENDRELARHAREGFGPTPVKTTRKARGGGK